MLSKEEIEKWSNEEKVEALAKFVALRSGNPEKALLYGFMLDSLLDEIDKQQEYIKQLELDKQKLIKKLEKDIKKNNEIEFMPLQIQKAYNNYYKLGRIDEAQEILTILKGENDE